MVPDEGTWLLWGRDPRASGLHPVLSPSNATTLVAPSFVPHALVPALRDLWDQMPRGREIVCFDAATGGDADTRHALEHDHAHARHDMSAHGGHEGHGHHGAHEGHDTDGGHEGHGDHDHHAMMAVTGDPSRDGLVMEDVDVTLGPIASPLPTGIVAHLTLDGDVVCNAHLESTFSEPDSLVPDPTTPAAWAAALDVAGGDATSWIADVELERAASHARFFMALGTLLGWAQLAETAVGLARGLQGSPGDRLAEQALTAAARLERLARSRRLRFSLRGIGIVGREHAEHLGLAGPNARASGVAADARSGHGAYEGLGFEPVVEDGGDALARALVRVREIHTSLTLLARWPERPRVAVAQPTEVEGPRGPVAIRPVEIGRAAEMDSRGQTAALAAAAESARQLEWSDALVALHSFDLSGWRVG